MAILLRGLQRARNQCEYDNQVPRLPRMVRRALQDANMIISQL
jgi:hypothetical protein